MSLQALQDIQAAAFAAWKSCPDKSRAEKARLAADLDVAAKAVAAAKRAAEPAAAVVDQASVLAAWKEKQAEKAAERDLEKRVAAAARLFQEAQDWPRCGQSWPTGEAEEAAASLLVGLNECARTDSEEAALEAALAAKWAAKNAAAVERQHARAQLLAASAPAEKNSKTIAGFAALVPNLTAEEAESVGFSHIAIKAAEGNRAIVVNMRGHILAKGGK